MGSFRLYRYLCLDQVHNCHKYSGICHFRLLLIVQPRSPASWLYSVGTEGRWHKDAIIINSPEGSGGRCRKHRNNKLQLLSGLCWFFFFWPVRDLFALCLTMHQGGKKNNVVAWQTNSGQIRVLREKWNLHLWHFRWASRRARFALWHLESGWGVSVKKPFRIHKPHDACVLPCDYSVSLQNNNSSSPPILRGLYDLCLCSCIHAILLHFPQGPSAQQFNSSGQQNQRLLTHLLLPCQLRAVTAVKLVFSPPSQIFRNHASEWQHASPIVNLLNVTEEAWWGRSCEQKETSVMSAIWIVWHQSLIACIPRQRQQ